LSWLSWLEWLTIFILTYKLHYEHLYAQTPKNSEHDYEAVLPTIHVADLFLSSKAFFRGVRGQDKQPINGQNLDQKNFEHK